MITARLAARLVACGYSHVIALRVGTGCVSDLFSKCHSEEEARSEYAALPFPEEAEIIALPLHGGRCQVLTPREFKESEA